MQKQRCATFFLGILFLTFGTFVELRSQDEQNNGAWTLQECVSFALKNNLNVKRNELEQRSRDIDLKLAKYSRLPNLNASGNYGGNFGRSIDPTTNLFVQRNIEIAQINANSTTPIFNGFSIKNSIKQAELNAESSYYDLQKSKNDVQLDVVSAYLEVILNRELAKNAEFQINTLDEQIKITDKRVQVGELPISNLLDLKAQRASATVESVNAENSAAISLLRLKQILQIPAVDRFDVVEPEVEVEDFLDDIWGDSEELYKAAEMTMPEIKSADLQIQSAEMGISIAKADLYPSLNFNSGLATNFSSIANQPRPIIDGSVPVVQEVGFLTDDPSRTVSAVIDQPNIVRVEPDFGLIDQFNQNLSVFTILQVSIPVFNRWQTRGNVQRSYIQLEQAKINSQDTRNQLRQAVESSFNDAFAALKTYEASTSQVSSLEESFRMIERQFNSGAVNFLEYQTTNNNLFRARSDLLRSKYEFIFRRKILDFYQGIPLEF